MPETVPIIDRQRIEQCDELVRENRVLIALLFPVIGALSLVVGSESLLPAVTMLAFNPLFLLIGVVVMRLPLVAGITPLLDRRTTATLLALTIYAYGIEYLGVSTGVPYGEFSYGVALGPMLFGAIPLALPLFFIPLVLNSYLLCLLLLGERANRTLVRIPVVVVSVIGMDLVLDPAAVDLGFWSYATAGLYYGVPLSNYLGWCVSASVAAVTVEWGFDLENLHTRLNECEFMLDSLVAFVVFWGIVNVYFGNLLPAIIACLFGFCLFSIDRLDFDVFPNRDNDQ